MATVNYFIRGKNNPCQLLIRFRHTREIDCKRALDIYINKEHWDSKNQRVKNVVSLGSIATDLNLKLAQLKIKLIEAYNLASLQGETTDVIWFESKLKEFLNRPLKANITKIPKHEIYFSDFAEWWLDRKSPFWLTSANKYMPYRQKQHYFSFVKKVVDFEGKRKIKLNSCGYDKINEFVKWMHQGGYEHSTMQRNVKRWKFFCSRANEEGLKIDSSFERRVFVPESKEVLDPYLSEEEITKIFNTEMPNESLENAKDNLLIGCWTGLRVSDYLKQLDISNFIDDYIEIKTQKTNTRVTIPIHPMVKKILIKRNGQLPKKINDVAFNRQIKEVCKLAGINNEIEGKKMSSKSKRKELGLYKKYELVTSHIGRRSFATNHFGKISNSVIMSICGWSKEAMMLKYIKKSNREGAVALKKYWEQQFKTNE